MGIRCVLFLMIFFTAIPLSWSQKILKVQGNKAVISIKSIDVEEGDVLTITSDGFEAGKLKILKVGSKVAVGKITEGSALKGDTVSSGSSSGGSSSKKSESDSEEDYPEKKSKRKSKYSRSTKFGAYIGIPYAMMANIATAQGDYELDGHSGFLLKGEYKAGSTSYFFGLETTSGDATFNSKLSTLQITGVKVSTTNLFGRIAQSFSGNFYSTYGAQFSLVKVEDTLSLGNITGAHSINLKGLGGLGGLGYNFFLGPVIIQPEALIEINYYFMNSASVPAGSTTPPDVKTFMTYGIQLGVSVGYRF